MSEILNLGGNIAIATFRLHHHMKCWPDFVQYVEANGIKRAFKALIYSTHAICHGLI